MISVYRGNCMPHFPAYMWHWTKCVFSFMNQDTTKHAYIVFHLKFIFILCSNKLVSLNKDVRGYVVSRLSTWTKEQWQSKAVKGDWSSRENYQISKWLKENWVWIFISGRGIYQYGKRENSLDPCSVLKTLVWTNGRHMERWMYT